MNFIETITIREARDDLKRRIVDEGIISPDGGTLWIEPLNRRTDPGFVDQVSKAARDWVEGSRIITDRARTEVAAVEGSGGPLAVLIGQELDLPTLIFKNHEDKVVFGERVSQKLDSKDEKQLSIYANKEHLKGQSVMAVDDFARRGTTIDAIGKITEKAGGNLIGIFAAVKVPSLTQAEILHKVPSFYLVEIKEMIAGHGKTPAAVRFDKENLQALRRKWKE